MLCVWGGVVYTILVMNLLASAPKQLQLIQTQTAQIFSHPTWDLILLFLLIAGGFFYGISFGRARVVANILYTYAAFAVVSALPLDSIISAVKIGELFFAKSGILLAIFLLLALLVGGRRRRWGFGGSGSWWQTFVLSVLQVGLLMHFMLQFLPKAEIAKLAPLTKTIFADPSLHIWWVLCPLVILIIFRRIDIRDDY